MLTDLQKKTAHAIVNVFETGTPHGDYGKVTVLRNDSGHLTYGRSQTTLASGNLHLLVKAYTEAPEAATAAELVPFLGRLAARDVRLDQDEDLHRLLRLAANDPVMHGVQDRFFDRVYWEPSIDSAEATGVMSGLGSSVVYDSKVHGSWGRMRDRTIERHGRVSDVGERDWIGHYVTVRREWLANHANTLLHRTVYRMEAFRILMDTEKWNLALPLPVRGVLVNEEVLAGAAVRVSAEDRAERVLVLQMPWMTGDDVEVLQQALNRSGFSLPVDGIYGPATEAAVRRFQQRGGLRVDGAAGPATRARLPI